MKTNGAGESKTGWCRRVFRVRKEDSAYLYAVFEAHEGVAVATTLRHTVGDLHRDIELQHSPDFSAELERILDGLRAEVELVELTADQRPPDQEKGTK